MIVNTATGKCYSVAAATGTSLGWLLPDFCFDSLTSIFFKLQAFCQHAFGFYYKTEIILSIINKCLLPPIMGARPYSCPIYGAAVHVFQNRSIELFPQIGIECIHNPNALCKSKMSSGQPATCVCTWFVHTSPTESCLPGIPE